MDTIQTNSGSPSITKGAKSTETKHHESRAETLDLRKRGAFRELLRGGSDE